MADSVRCQRVALVLSCWRDRVACCRGRGEPRRLWRGNWPRLCCGLPSGGSFTDCVEAAAGLGRRPSGRGQGGPHVMSRRRTRISPVIEYSTRPTKSRRARGARKVPTRLCRPPRLERPLLAYRRMLGAACAAGRARQYHRRQPSAWHFKAALRSKCPPPCFGSAPAWRRWGDLISDPAGGREAWPSRSLTGFRSGRRQRRSWRWLLCAGRTRGTDGHLAFRSPVRGTWPSRGGPAQPGTVRRAGGLSFHGLPLSHRWGRGARGTLRQGSPPAVAGRFRRPKSACQGQLGFELWCSRRAP